MKILGSKSGLAQGAGAGAVAAVVAGCKRMEPKIDDFYMPTAHYERHPIIVTKSGAHAKRVRRLAGRPERDRQNDAYENFGCAQQNNIAAMVANPRGSRQAASHDAVRPDASRKVFDNYRNGEAVASAQREQQQRGQDFRPFRNGQLDHEPRCLEHRL